MPSLAVPLKNNPFSGSCRPPGQSREVSSAAVLGNSMGTLWCWLGLKLMLRAEDDGGGDVAVLGDQDVEGAAQGAVVHHFEADTLLAEQGEYLRRRE